MWNLLSQRYKDLQVDSQRSNGNIKGDVRVDRLVGLEIERDLLLLTFVGQDCTDEENEAIRRDTVVQLETLLCGRDGRKHRESIDTGLDVRSRTVLLS